jgi:predicted TPR repeat methyltransferase
MAFFVMHFFEDIDAVFKRVNQLLKPGGLFISETACLGEKGRLLGASIRLAGNLGLLPRINILTTHQIEQALANAGFSIIDKTKYSNQPDAEYTLIARKSH